MSDKLAFIALDLIFLAALLVFLIVLAGWPGALVWLVCLGLYLHAWTFDFHHKDRP